jgi:hypothetical protein
MVPCGQIQRAKADDSNILRDRVRPVKTRFGPLYFATADDDIKTKCKWAYKNQASC